MAIANPKVQTVRPVTYGGHEAHYEIALPDGKSIQAEEGCSLDCLMDDPEVTKFQPNQIVIKIVYDK